MYYTSGRIFKSLVFVKGCMCVYVCVRGWVVGWVGGLVKESAHL